MTATSFTALYAPQVRLIDLATGKTTGRIEMSNEQVVHRFAAGETGIDSQRLRSGQLRCRRLHPPADM